MIRCHSRTFTQYGTNQDAAKFYLFSREQQNEHRVTGESVFMASIKPIMAFRYNSDLQREIGYMIAPPYDVIAPDEVEQYQNHPLNITHLTLPQPGDGLPPYEHARAELDRWIESGLLVHADDPALYIYEQRFEDPSDGITKVRRGVIAGLLLEDFGPGGVLPHERTLRKHREDRRNLRNALQADVEAIFGMVRTAPSLSQLYDECGRTPDTQVEDRQGVVHRLWTITDPMLIELVVDDFKEREVFIVDGHHRYTVALQQAREEGFGANHPLGSILMMITSMDDPGLIILPTHRIIHSVDPETISRLPEQLSRTFTLTNVSDPASGFLALAASAERGTLLFCFRDRTLLGVPNEGAWRAMRARHGEGSPLAQLDVTLLHNLVLEDQLGISKELQESGTSIRYSRDRAEAMAALDQEDVQLVVGMNPPSVEQVEAVAVELEVMPQKSTFFYPKLASGLLINRAVDISGGTEE